MKAKRKLRKMFLEAGRTGPLLCSGGSTTWILLVVYVKKMRGDRSAEGQTTTYKKARTCWIWEGGVGVGEAIFLLASPESI